MINVFHNKIEKYNVENLGDHYQSVAKIVLSRYF